MTTNGLVAEHDTVLGLDIEVVAVDVKLLDKRDERSLRGLANLAVLAGVVVDARVVADGADGGQLLNALVDLESLLVARATCIQPAISTNQNS